MSLTGRKRFRVRAPTRFDQKWRWLYDFPGVASLRFLLGNAAAALWNYLHESANGSCVLRSDPYPDFLPDSHTAGEGVRGMGGEMERTGFLASSREEATPRRGLSGITQFRSTSTATERLRISTETTKRQEFFSSTNTPSTPCRGPHSTRTRSPRSR